jgi:hypothetical protein
MFGNGSAQERRRRRLADSSRASPGALSGLCAGPCADWDARPEPSRGANTGPRGRPDMQRRSGHLPPRAALPPRAHRVAEAQPRRPRARAGATAFGAQPVYEGPRKSAQPFHSGCRSIFIGMSAGMRPSRLALRYSLPAHRPRRRTNVRIAAKLRRRMREGATWSVPRKSPQLTQPRPRYMFCGAPGISAGRLPAALHEYHSFWLRSPSVRA